MSAKSLAISHCTYREQTPAHVNRLAQPLGAVTSATHSGILPGLLGVIFVRDRLIPLHLPGGEEEPRHDERIVRAMTVHDPRRTPDGVSRVDAERLAPLVALPGCLVHVRGTSRTPPGPVARTLTPSRGPWADDIPDPVSIFRNWPFSCQCPLVRAPGVKVTVAQSFSIGAG